MRAVVNDSPGGPEVLRLAEIPDPALQADEVLIEVVASGVNRADLLQRQGFYPPPVGASTILGLECSGRIADVGRDVDGWRPGDEVCALLTGGGYASRVAVPAGQVMPLPPGVSLDEAAGVPEVAATVYSNLAMTAHLAPPEWLLIHGGASGIGTFATQWANAIGAKVIVTTGGPGKQEFCRSLGAEVAIDYHVDDFTDAVLDATGGAGVDVILDIMGAKYLDANVASLALRGRLVIIGLQGGVKGELNLGQLLIRGGTIHATSLRARSAAEKADICTQLVTEVWPLIGNGQVRPIIDDVVPVENVIRAHERLDQPDRRGKVVLSWT